MHLEFKVLLTGNLISNVSLEVSLFRTFLKRLIGVTIFRTEWMIFATRENIAGSIDFVGRTDEGSLVYATGNEQRTCVTSFVALVAQCDHPWIIFPMQRFGTIVGN